MSTSFRLLAFVLATFCLVITTSSVQAQEFSGRAIGISGTVTINGVPSATIAVSDTGPLPSTGGTLTASNPGFNLSGVLTTGASTASTSGSGITSQSAASLSTLDVNITGISTDLRVRADTVGANTNCRCATALCGGGAVVTNLRVGQLGGGTVITVTGAVNQTVSFTSGTQSVTIVINEQTGSLGNITVNGLHITTTDSLTGLTLDVVVASAYSDIACVLIPTAAGASISGRVLTASGAPIYGVRVTLTGQTGDVYTGLTNPFGFYSVDDVPVGGTYLAEAGHRLYVFEPRVISVKDNVTGFDFTATSP